MRRDHRPYYMRRLYIRFQRLYAEHIIRPQLEYLGEGHSFVRPWNVRIFGGPVSLGRYANVIASADAKVRLSVWGEKKNLGRIDIGDYALICPGVQIGSACEIIVGHSCMLANGVYITDSDWHDPYNRLSIGKTAPVRLKDNVWLGHGVIVCKGVTIGENSIIGAGAVVSNNIPSNSVAAGNPAKIVKRLDPKKRFRTRADWYRDPTALFSAIDREARNMLQGNSFFHWLRVLLFPKEED